MDNRLRMLEAAGQAIWLDFLDRRFLAEGGFARLIEQDGLTGITSNPSIFEKAIVEGSAYNDDIAAFLSQREASAAEVYERLAVADLQTAADALRPAYDRLMARTVSPVSRCRRISLTRRRSPLRRRAGFGRRSTGPI